MEQTDISALLSGVMNNPEIMGKLSGMLSDPETVGRLKQTLSPEEGKSPSLPLSLPVQSDEAKNRARLISALKPYLNEDRRGKADKLLGLLTLLELSGSQNLFKGGK